MIDDPLVVWVDAQVSPGIARWLRTQFGINAVAVRDLGLRNAEDPVIFAAAREAGVVVITKDSDFLQLLERHGPPPRVVWLTCGNTSNAYLRRLLLEAWPRVASLLGAGEQLVEISASAI